MKFFQKIQGTHPAVICGLGTLFLLSCRVEQDEARSESIGFSPQTMEYASFSKIEAPQCRGGEAFSAYYLESALMGKEGGDSLFLHICSLASIPCHLTGNGAFGISAFCYTGTWNSSLSASFMHNERVTPPK
ncbi:hypothetical protein [Bacteroides helcogenes]|uniref:Lipoprotein n=1 Tax=Bacteroides helcogenes (strain ATCC 35417 / DSM 20613 / JCM 6297 / CCUG 15421 / P 36-108) TaxID=693979 RepID=E6SVD2_BACT6|nr:hypothetical protein [Bacteroides helcogenes]ADV44498.1 hypothetical protein Bache_2536 [Bacteroides helcogenes P 36-108]MDY5239027.1 hypothetical protein [Bacteroides helcogenes]